VKVYVGIIDTIDRYDDNYLKNVHMKTIYPNSIKSVLAEIYQKRTNIKINVSLVSSEIEELKALMNTYDKKRKEIKTFNPKQS
jgi:hypothetical protein